MELASSHIETSFGTRLLTCRQTLGLSQVELAHLLGTTQQTVGRWEQGQTPQPRFVRAIREFLQEHEVETGPARVVSLSALPGGLANDASVALNQRILDAVVGRVESGERIEEAEAKLLTRLLRIVDGP